MIIFKTVLSVFQVLLIISIMLSCKNRNDLGVSALLSLYMVLVGVALWL